MSALPTAGKLQQTAYLLELVEDFLPARFWDVLDNLQHGKKQHTRTAYVATMLHVVRTAGSQSPPTCIKP